MDLSPLLIRTLIYIIRSLAVIKGKGVIEADASELTREWEALIREKQ